jgi:hypothetical protein
MQNSAATNYLSQIYCPTPSAPQLTVVQALKYANDLNENRFFDEQSQKVLENINQKSHSLKTYQKIKDESKQGVVNNLLDLIIKVNDIALKATLFIGVAFILAVSVPVTSLSYLALALSPLAIRAIFTYAVVNFALKQMKEVWIDHSFRKAYQAEVQRSLNIINEQKRLDVHLNDIENGLKIALQITVMANENYSHAQLYPQIFPVSKNEIERKINSITTRLDHINTFRNIHWIEHHWINSALKIKNLR